MLSRSKRIFSQIFVENLLLISLIIISTIIFSVVKPKFFSVNTFSTMMSQLPEIGLFTFAMTLPMLIGGIDLSIITSANLSAILMTMFMNSAFAKGQNEMFITILSIIICMALCIFIGFINGFIIAKFQIPAMLVTLGMQMFLKGLALGITRGKTLTGYLESFKKISNGFIFNIPIQFIIFIVAAFVLYIILQKTTLGVRLRMYGSNIVATIYSGVDEPSLLIKTYMLVGAYVGLASIVMTSRLTSAGAETAEPYLMRTILIAVLGNVNPNGGKGRVSGVVCAVLLFQIISTGLNTLINPYTIIAIYGVVLLLSIFANARKNRF